MSTPALIEFSEWYHFKNGWGVDDFFLDELDLFLDQHDYEIIKKKESNMKMRTHYFRDAAQASVSTEATSPIKQCGICKQSVAEDEQHRCKKDALRLRVPFMFVNPFRR